MSTYSGQFVLRIAPELHEALDKTADQLGLSLNQYIANTLTAHVATYPNVAPTPIRSTYSAVIDTASNSTPTPFAANAATLIGATSPKQTSLNPTLEFLNSLPAYRKRGKK